MRTTDERLDEHTESLQAHTLQLEQVVGLLGDLNEHADRQTEQLAAIVAQLRTMNDGIIRALSAATRLDGLEDRVRALERR